MSSSSLKSASDAQIHVKAAMIDEETNAKAIGAETGVFATLTKWLGDQGVETRGVERVPEQDRVNTPAWQQLLFWTSVNSSYYALSVGYLGSYYFDLTFKTSAAVQIPFLALGACLSAGVATLGPVYGLRTMVLGRFAGGFAGTFMFSLINVICLLCYAVGTAIAGGQALAAVNSNLSIVVGIVVCSAITLVFSLVGLSWMHTLERYSWMVCVTIICLVLGLNSKGNYDPNYGIEYQPTGRALVGSVLSFGGVCFSVSSGWSTIAADYNVTMRSDMSRIKVFLCTFFGIFLPTTFCGLASAALWSTTADDYIQARTLGGLGGAVEQALSPAKAFGKILVVVLALSTVSGAVLNSYSGALCFQSLHPICRKVPRPLFVVLFTVIFLAAAIAGREHFSEIVANVAAMLAYYTSFFTAVLFLEMFYFRRPGGLLGSIDPDNTENWGVLPPGFACIGTICFAAGGAAISMASVYWVGPVAEAIVNNGTADLGFEFSFVFSTIAFFVLRHAEIWYFKR